MGIANQGMFGNSHGKVGNLVYYMRNGKQIVRKIGISTKPPTEAQKENRLRMSVTSAFCKLVRPFTDYGFEGLTVGRDLSPHNVAVSYNKLNALQGAYPDFSIDYARALVAEGPLVHADDAKVEITDGGLQFSWHVDPQLRWPDTTDQAMLLAIFPDQDRMAYQLFGAPRTAGTSLLEISAPMLDKYMETYIAFISADRKQVSTSIYVGALNR